ncbi:MAG: hypothetical protein ABI425_00095 [Patescibacteria group bacterium]
MLQNLKKEFTAKVALLIFLFFTAFWLTLFLFEKDSIWHAAFGSSYGVLAAFGGFIGLSIAQRWGGFKSIMGKSVLFFSFGLLLQTFGQIAYTLYIYVLKIELPYPSIGDIGYFGSIPCYVYGVFLLAKASGVRLSIQRLRGQLLFLILPGVLLLLSYFMFLQGYVFDWSNPLAIFLDFGYPFGQAIYVSLAFLTYLLSRNILGGIMRNKILFLLFALVIQYLSDFSFLYLVDKGWWFVGGVNDYIYLVAYFLMTLALIQLKTVSDTLTKK